MSWCSYTGFCLICKAKCYNALIPNVYYPPKASIPSPPPSFPLLLFTYVPLYLNCMAEFPISFGPAPRLKAGGLRVPAGVGGFDLSSARRRPASLLAPSLCRPPRLTQARRCHLAFPQRALPPLGSAEPQGGDTHARTHTHSRSPLSHTL